MRKINILFAAFCFQLATCNLLCAQNNAMKVLDATAARVGQAGGISGNFTATGFSGKKVKNEISGSIIMQGQKYVLSTPDMHTWYNGEYQWSLISGSDEVSRTKPTAQELHKSSPASFLGIYKSGYDLSIKTVKLRGKKTNEITMKATAKTRQPQRIIVDIDPSTNDPLCMRILYKGEWTRVTITNIHSAGAKPGDFEFPSKDYPKISVVNM